MPDFAPSVENFFKGKCAWFFFAKCGKFFRKKVWLVFQKGSSVASFQQASMPEFVLFASILFWVVNCIWFFSLVWKILWRQVYLIFPTSAANFTKSKFAMFSAKCAMFFKEALVPDFVLSAANSFYYVCDSIPSSNLSVVLVSRRCCVVMVLLPTYHC